MRGAGGVNFDAVAGGEQDDFGFGESGAEFFQSFALLRRIERDFFADLERGGITKQMTAFDDRQEALEWVGTSVKEIPETAR